MANLVPKITPFVLALMAIILVGYATWTLKPPEYREVPTHDTLYVPADSATIIKEAIRGKIVGTYDELVEKFGKVVKKVRIIDSLNIVDSTHWDTLLYSIPTLESRDTLNYSGVSLLNEDTLRVSLRVRVYNLALLEPIYAIQNTIVVDSIKIIVPPEPGASLLSRIKELWWLPLAGAIAWEIIR